MKVIEIVSFKDGKVIHSLDVTERTESAIDRIDSGMNRNFNHNEYYTRIT